MNGCFYQILFLQINLKEYGFCATYSFTIIVSELKYKNNLQSRESQKKKKKKFKTYNYHVYVYVLLRNPGVLPRF